MPLPSDFTPASQAIHAAVTTIQSWPGSIPLGELFARLRTKQDNASASTKVHEKKRVVVLLSQPRVVTEHRNCDRASYELDVSITRLYRPGKVEFDAELDASVNRALRDMHLVAQALTMPPVLAFAPNGEATGIDGGALQTFGRASDGPLVDESAGEGAGVVRMTDYFTARITLAAVGS